MTGGTDGGAPDGSRASRPHMETQAEREARIAWEQGGTSLIPPVGRIADRVVTVLLLAATGVMTIVTAVIALVAVLASAPRCHPASGCSTGALVGGGALAAGGAFVVGVAALVLAVWAWIRRRSSWWIAAIGFVVAIGCVVGGGVLSASALGDLGGTTPAGDSPWPGGSGT
ncbi:DUF6264 family protein [Curtobacterium sp. MCBD17_035]|uniref:DUF6264 family protein n=1 Tax=Curtobacterium sp. MCBD17_035 TaxID=2175673 RepID=UPI000DA92DBF|nr:DUF6264 family protein [Curtobacterium sp. MCBD17_035]WIB67010.1 DUF6264 family protein [Curtobacterium sp. MCBD17_035]